MFKNSNLLKIVITFIIFLFSFQFNIYADDIDINEENIDVQTEVSAQNTKDISINSRNAVVIDRISNSILFRKKWKQ